VPTLSSGFTVVIHNNAHEKLRCFLLPKENKIDFWGKKEPFQVMGDPVRKEDFPQEISPGEKGFFAFTPQGIIRNEVQHYLIFSYDCPPSPEWLETYKNASEEDKLYVQGLHPRLLTDSILSMTFGICIYMETRSATTRVILHDAMIHIQNLNAAKPVVVMPHMVYSLHKPQVLTLPLDEFLISTSLRKKDPALLDVILVQNPNLEVNAMVKALFLSVDRNHNGEISKTEFIDFIKSKNSKLPQHALDEMFNALDSDASGSIDFSEFLNKQQQIRKFIEELSLEFDPELYKQAQKSGKTSKLELSTCFK